MTLIRWDPFRDLLSLQDRVHQAMSRPTVQEGSQTPFATWSPSVDVFENEDELVLRAELPGVEREDIDIRVDQNTLELEGERKLDNEMEQGRTHRTERVFGAFKRRFTLPKDVDAAAIKAVHRNGVLEIVLPKAATAKPRTIEISAA